MPTKDAEVIGSEFESYDSECLNKNILGKFEEQIDTKTQNSAHTSLLEARYSPQKIIEIIISMSDTTCSSDCHSEIGYISEEIESTNNARKKQQNEERQKKKINRKNRELRRSKMFSNDSDTTIESHVVIRRRNKGLKSRDLKAYYKSNKICLRSQNESKISWTDSGISLSKTDSQPSTLGDGTSAKFASPRRLEAKERSIQNDRNEQIKSSIKSKDISSQHATREGNYEHGVRKRIDRSKSAPVFNKNETDVEERLGKFSGKALYKFNEDEVVIKTYEVTENDKEAGKKIKRKTSSSKLINTGNIRCPEIIKKADIDREYEVVGRISEKEAATQTSPIPLQHKLVNDTATIGDADLYTEKESEIINQLIRNAKIENSKKNSSCSNETISSFSIEKSTRLEKLKKFFKIKRKSSLANEMLLKEFGVDHSRDSKVSPTESPLSQDYLEHSNCTGHFCFCDVSDEVTGCDDQLANLGRTVSGKKRNFFRKLFSSQSRTAKQSVEEDKAVRTRQRQSLSDLGIKQKRSGSTRSLPESLRGLWFRTRTHSIESFPLPANQIPQPGKHVLRSSSNYSLHSHQFHSCITNMNADLRSPLSPVRRSRSSRSLNISGNFDIATHLLQPKVVQENNIDNNNMFYHSYYEGHTSQPAQKQVNYPLGQTQCCCMCPEELRHNLQSTPVSLSPTQNSVIFGQEDFNNAYVFSDHYYNNHKQETEISNYGTCCGMPLVDADDTEVIAPLSVMKAQKKRAEKIRLK